MSASVIRLFIFVHMAATLILASQSPRRAALIRLLGIASLKIQPSDLHEEMLPELSPAQNVARLAIDKARYIRDSVTGPGVILGADTTVVLGNEMLEKPRDQQDAIEMLTKLSGNTHTVFTGVGLVDAGSQREESFWVETKVTFRELEQDEIIRYVATGAPMDKAGAYGIQEDFGAVFVREIVGDYYNVVGLPLCELYQRLRKFEPALFDPLS
jgi:septum formation protein